jgi:ABC-type multidrug transport system fused ATPase/permease subunit
MPVLIIAAAFLGKVLSEGASKTQDACAKAVAVAEEAISGMRTVAAFSAEDHFFDKFARNLEEAYRCGVKAAIGKGIGIGAFLFSLFCTFAVAVFYGSRLIARGEMTSGQVINVLFSIIIGAFYLGQGVPNIGSFAKAKAAAYNIFQTIERKSRIPSDSSEGVVLTHCKGAIAFHNVCFSYPSRENISVLLNFSLTIPSGKTVALVGESGSGKSTIVQLLERFYEPHTGIILLDNKNINEINIKSLRDNIGIVSQQPVLYNRSIRENVLCGLPTWNENGQELLNEKYQALVERACKAANAHEFIKNLPRGASQSFVFTE